MAQLVPVDTFDLIIIGGSGDLALRKLLPALYHRNCDQQITAESRIIAVSRAEMTGRICGQRACSPTQQSRLD